MPAHLAILTAVLLGGGDPAPVDFDTEIVPVLTRAGCNTGECHGAAVGRGGFKLSLFGGDPAADYGAIVRELEGRRVNLARPEESLVVLKPTETLSHGGGTRIEPESDEAELLLRWIRSGAPRLQARRLVEFRIEPARAIVEPGAEIALRATGVFGDGGAGDVTASTLFTAADPAAVQWSDDRSRVRALRRGATVIVARYLDRVVPVQVLVPLGEEPVDLSGEPRSGFIDEESLATLTDLRIPVSPEADDATFLRRVRLDLTGRLPSPDEVRKFLADSDPEKRSRLIDRLLNSQEFVEYWTFKLAKLLRVGAGRQEPEATQAYYGWLRQQVAAGTGYDDLARTLLLAEGDSHAFGPANFYRVAADARMQAEFVGELFLGVRLGCANCHNHPLDRWTQEDYHGLAALLAGIERGRVVRSGMPGEIINPRTGEAAVPRIPGARDLPGTADGREALAEWLARPENPYFARAIVNRLWKALMGRGLVEPDDDLSSTNPATHPELLDRLAADFVSHGCDLRHTLRLIATSAAYARSSRSLPANEADDRFYSHFRPQPLEAEVLADAVADVTEIPEQYGRLPLGTRAIALVDPATPAPSLDVLGRCERGDACESPAGASGGLATRLHLLNGPLLNRRISAAESRLGRLLALRAENSEVVEEFYLAALSRSPSDDERAFWADRLGEASDEAARKGILEDFVWALLSCREFVTDH